MSYLLMFNRVYRLEIQSVMLYPKVKVQNIQAVCGWEGGEVVDLCWRPYSAGV
jgi:hypothetical protein